MIIILIKIAGSILNTFKQISLAVVLSSCFFGVASANNIVQNGSFETGDFTDWTASNMWSVGTDYGTLTPAAGGSYFAATGCSGTECMGLPGTNRSAYFSQVLTTTPGQTYNLSFSLTNNGGPINEVSAHWGNSQVFDLKNWSATQAYQAGTLYNDYTVTGLVATGTSIILTFNARQDPIVMGIDNISVVAAPVPEPETYAMLLAGFGLIGAAVKRRKAKQA